jgi:uncharacterized membrane protein
MAPWVVEREPKAMPCDAWRTGAIRLREFHPRGAVVAFALEVAFAFEAAVALEAAVAVQLPVERAVTAMPEADKVRRLSERSAA